MEVQKALQQTVYAVRFLDEISKTTLDKKSLAQIVDTLKSIKIICTSEEDFKVFADQLSDLAVARVLLGVTHSVLKLGLTAETWPCLHALRSACISLSDRFESFCSDFGSTGFVAIPANELKRYEKVNISENPTVEFLVASALALLGNCAKAQSVIQILWDMNITKVLLSYTNSPSQHICIQALLLFGLLSLDVNDGSILMSDEQVSALQGALISVTSGTSLTLVLGDFMLSAAELIEGINGLALNKKNAILLMKSGVLAPIIKILSGGSFNDKRMAIAFLWTLATESSNQENFKSSKELRQSLDSMLQSEPKLEMIVKYLLLRIDGWNHFEGVSDTLMYVECAYHQRRYQECVAVCETVCSELSTTKYSEKNCNFLKLITGKCLYFILENFSKFRTIEKNESIRDRRKTLIAERVVRVLGPLVDNGSIDEIGIQYLDIAMVHCIREANNLGNCERCLLCHSKRKLQSSHIVPKFILAGFAKGMKRSTSKKEYLIKGISSEELERTPKRAAWYMLCKECEQKISSQGESSFARDFFQEVYKVSDPSSTAKKHSIEYSEWLYQFAVGLIFRSLAINPKGITGFINDDDIYKLFTQCRRIVLQPDKLSTDHPQIALFINPLSIPESASDLRTISTIHRILNMPSFMHLLENEEKVGHYKIPRIANFFLAHLGILNFTVNFHHGEFNPPTELCINTQSGSITLPEETERLSILPQPIWEALNLAAQHLESQEMRVTREKLQSLKVYESSPKVPEAEETVFGLAKAKQSDIELVKKMGFQPSSDPRFPKEFNLLPPNFFVCRESMSKDYLKLPAGHQLLFHWTLGKEQDTGVTFFLCISSDDCFEHRPYIIAHRFMPGLNLNVGFFVSSEDLTPEELLPDDSPKVYADALLSDYQSKTILQSSFFRLLSKIGTSLHDILKIGTTKGSHIAVKCLPNCWFCEGRCDACSTPANDSLSLYGQEILFCSKNCLNKLVKPPPSISALPKDFSIRNEFKCVREVTVPDGHSLITHLSTPFNSENGSNGELTIFLCKANKTLEHRLYILCHFHSFVEQFSVGMFISKENFQPLETLPGTSCDETHTFYLESLYTTEIVQMILLHTLSKHKKESIDGLLSYSENEDFHDKKCRPPCWYCMNRCTNCFTICTSNKDEYCSDSCRNKFSQSPPHLFTSIPESFVVSRSFDKEKPSLVTLPKGHHCLFHTTGNSCKPDGTVGSEMTIILCIGDGTPPYLLDKPYVIFQHYNLIGNRLANVGFYVSPNDLSIQEPLCIDDMAGHIFIDRLKSDCNVPEGIHEALKQRGYSNMTSFLEKSARKEVLDIKCSPPCWYCKYRCDVCVKQADIQTDINGEQIRHCSDACLEKIFTNPGIIHLLPGGFSIRSSQNLDECEVKLPNNHQAVLHAHCEYKRNDGRNGNYLLILCVNTKQQDETFPAFKPYVLYHQFNLLRQITFGFYVTTDSLEPSQPLSCEKQEQRLKCLRFLQQVTKLEPIASVLQTKLKEHDTSLLKPEELTLVKDKPCAASLSCWYCKKMNLL